MKLLLDENLPKRLKLDLPEHDVRTVADMQWTGKKNGELLELMVAEGFDALLTFDKNLQYQQNFRKYSLPVLVLVSPSNTYLSLRGLVDKIKEVLKDTLQPGANIVEMQ